MVENQPFWVCVGEKCFNRVLDPRAGVKSVSTVEPEPNAWAKNVSVPSRIVV